MIGRRDPTRGERCGITAYKDGFAYSYPSMHLSVPDRRYGDRKEGHARSPASGFDKDPKPLAPSLKKSTQSATELSAYKRAVYGGKIKKDGLLVGGCVNSFERNTRRHPHVSDSGRTNTFLDKGATGAAGMREIEPPREKVVAYSRTTNGGYWATKKPGGFGGESWGLIGSPRFEGAAACRVPVYKERFLDRERERGPANDKHVQGRSRTVYGGYLSGNPYLDDSLSNDLRTPVMWRLEPPLEERPRPGRPGSGALSARGPRDKEFGPTINMTPKHVPKLPTYRQHSSKKMKENRTSLGGFWSARDLNSPSEMLGKIRSVHHEGGDLSVRVNSNGKRFAAEEQPTKCYAEPNRKTDGKDLEQLQVHLSYVRGELGGYMKRKGESGSSALEGSMKILDTDMESSGKQPIYRRTAYGGFCREARTGIRPTEEPALNSMKVTGVRPLPGHSEPEGTGMLTFRAND